MTIPSSSIASAVNSICSFCFNTICEGRTRTVSILRESCSSPVTNTEAEIGVNDCVKSRESSIVFVIIGSG